MEKKRYQPQKNTRRAGCTLRFWRCFYSSGASLAGAAAHTPAGQRFSAWLTAFNSGDRATFERYLEKYNPKAMKSLDGQMAFRAMTGGFDVRKIGIDAHGDCRSRARTSLRYVRAGNDEGAGEAPLSTNGRCADGRGSAGGVCTAPSHEERADRRAGAALETAERRWRVCRGGPDRAERHTGLRTRLRHGRSRNACAEHLGYTFSHRLDE